MTEVLFAALVWQVIDFLRELADLPAQKSAIVTQLSAWIGGVLLVILACHANVTANLVPHGSDLPFHALNFGGQILVGLLYSSFASSLVDVKQSIDNHDSSAKPRLLASRAVRDEHHATRHPHNP